MKKRIHSIAAVWLLCGMTALLLSGCGSKERGEMTRIIFDRGHGSAWGNQLYIEICDREIVIAKYFPEGSADQAVCEHVPITAEQWETICASVQALDLREKRTVWFETLWGSQKLDGGEYRELAVIWDGETRIAYQWPDSKEANALEAMLEQLAVASE